MYKLLYPSRDATIYEKYPERNTGIDQILELTKFAVNEAVDDIVDEYRVWENNYNSRILLYFDVTSIKDAITAGTIDTGSAKYILTLNTTEAFSLPTDYTLYAYPLSLAWVNGNGNLHDTPQITNGVSWKYCTSEYDGTEWNPDSGSMLWSTVSGGGTWNSSYFGSQSFSLESPDVAMDITPIVNAWVNDVIPNYGLIVKHSNASETSSDILGSLKFFGRETHTIYLPKIQILWDSSTGYTGSFSTKTQVDFDYIISVRNLKSHYRVGETAKVRLGVRDQYPARTYSTSAISLVEKRLPDTAFYSIVDYVTGLEMVPFDDPGTAIQMDNSGHYINIDTTNFLPTRYYKILFKIITDSGTNIVDNNITFRVES